MHNNYINELLGFKDVKVKKVENNDFSITLHIETIKKRTALSLLRKHYI